MQAAILGNNCGHVPSAPRFFEVYNKRTERPKILELAKERVRHYYYLPMEYLRNLSIVNLSSSQQRSDRRECIAASLQVLLHYTDLDTLTVGTPQHGDEMLSIQLGFVAKKTGFGLKRIYRALKDLEAGSYIKIIFRRFKRFGKYLTIHRLEVLPALFSALKLEMVNLNMSRHYKRKSLEKKYASSYKKIAAKVAPTPQEQSALREQKQNQLKLKTILSQAGRISHKKCLPQPPPKPPAVVASVATHQDRTNYFRKRVQLIIDLIEKGIPNAEATAQADLEFPIIA